MTYLAAGTESDRLLEVAELGVEFRDADGTDVRLLRGVDLDVKPGEVVALVGESGCGKSLTAKAVLGLLPSPPLTVVSGRIAFAEHDLLALNPRDYQGLRGRALTLVPQHPLSSLNPVFTVGQQFFDLICFQGRARLNPFEYFAPRVRRRRRDEIRVQIVEALREVALPDPEEVIDKYPLELSGGMCQRILIAMALVGQPQLIIADEPGTALDVTIEAQINELLLDRVRAHGVAMLYITHDLGIARQISDRVFVMYAGRVIETGATAEVFRRPRHPYTRGLIDAVPKLSHEPVRGIRGTLPDPKTLDGRCAFRWRCAYAIEACGGTVPTLAVFGDRHGAACLRADELELA